LSVCFAADADEARATGIIPVLRRIQPSTGTRNRLSFAMNRGSRPVRNTAIATISGSNSE
jgi:hypothetical protein